MGWLISYDLTKEEQVAELAKGWEKDGIGVRCLDYSVRGNVMFAVYERYTKLPTGPVADPKDRWIGVNLLRKDRGYGYGYKDMSESMGPNEVNCPLKFLAMAPCPNEWGEQWRERVRAYHAARKAAPKIEVGDTLKFKPGITVLGEPLVEGKVTRKVRRSYLVAVGHCEARVTRKHVAEVVKG